MQQAGATVEPSEYTTLAQDEQFTGAWSQRSPLRDAAVPWLYRKFYSASRFDSIIDGVNREISMRLTDVRRPGSSIFNSSSWGQILGYYSFKYLQNNVEVVRLIVDTTTAVYDGTPASVGGPGKQLLWTKSAGAGATRFLGVGPTLYMGNGVDQVKWIQSSQTWAALSNNFSEGSFILDTNNNLQLNIGSQQATIIGAQVQGNVCTLFFSPTTQLTVPVATNLALSGLTGTLATTLNGNTYPLNGVENGAQVSFALTHGNVAFYTETGTASTGNGTTGSTQPTWATGAKQITVDAGSQWENRGSSIQQWMYGAPANAPSVTQTAAPTIYPSWVANTWYCPIEFIIYDPTSNSLQLLTTNGTTGGAPPAFSATPGNVTNDGTAQWTSLGSPAWVANHVYAVNAAILQSFTYYITVAKITYTWNGYANVPTVTFVQQQVNATGIYLCTVAGTSGAAQPGWTNGVGTTVVDNTATWQQVASWPTGSASPQQWSTIGATQIVNNAPQIIGGGNIQQPIQLGKTGATAPTWSPANGGNTTDNGIIWQNQGPYSAANTGAWTYAFSGFNQVTNDVTTASPISAPITQAAGQQIVLQGTGVQAVFDQIIIWRTPQEINNVQGTLIFDSAIPNPGPGSTWIFTDTLPDQGLNALIAAPIDSINNPPPAGFLPMAYHGQRIWGLVGAIIYFSGGPDILVGNGNDAYAPLNNFVLPEKGTRLKSVTVQGGGLLCVATTNTYIILGNGTSNEPYTPPQMYMERVGVLGYYEVDVVGSTFYAFTNCNKAVSLDPSAGYVEIGFPIGDQFLFTTWDGINQALYTPGSTFVTWHEKSSGDTGLYFCDGQSGWWRWSPIAPPESGSLWSPIAQITGGTSAVLSVETSPGVFNLLIGPAAGHTGPILFRDTTVNADWYQGEYQNFESYDTKGSIGLCESGEIAEVVHIALKCSPEGARPTVSLLIDEIAAGVTRNGLTSAWDVLSLAPGKHEDPPNLPASISMYSDRYRTQQGNGICPKCENLQIKFDFGSQNYPDELLKFAIYGGVFKERRQQ